MPNIHRRHLRKNPLPVLLHIHDGPAVPPGLVEGFVETANGRLTIVGIFAVGIGVMDDEAKARARPGGGPLDHLQVAVGVAASDASANAAASVMAINR